MVDKLFSSLAVERVCDLNWWALFPRGIKSRDSRNSNLLKRVSGEPVCSGLIRVRLWFVYSDRVLTTGNYDSFQVQTVS